MKEAIKKTPVSEQGLEEVKVCKKQFIQNNRFHFVMTVITQTIFSVVAISISLLMMVTLDAIEFTDLYRVKVAAIMLVTIISLYALFGVIQKRFRNRYLKTALTQYKQYIFTKILGKSINEFGVAKSSTVINTFSNDLTSLETHYLDGTLQMIQQSIMFVVAACMMFYLNVFLAVCILLACIIPVVFSMIFGRRLMDKEKKISDEGEGFVDQVKDLLNGFVVIKSFKAEKEILSLFERKNLSLEESKRDRRDTNDSVSLVSTLSSILVISMIFTVGLVLAYQGYMSIGEIIAFVELSHYSTGPLEKFFPLLSNKRAAEVLIVKIAENIKQQPQVEKAEIEKFEKAIELKDICFSYDEENEVLQHVNLTIEPGKSYAIVGGSGSGKTTLLQLLMGYYDSYEGQILYDGMELKGLSLDSLYDIIGVIQQNVFLFDSTMKDNISMFKHVDEDTLEQVIRLSGLDQLVKEKGLDYQCGEGGRNLSGGEKQRVSIARSLMRNVRVLLLDEATSALDSKTAYEVENSILQLKDLTKIVVTHKMNKNLLKMYDEIIVLKQGNVIEKGSFDELMEQKDYFYSFYSLS